MLRLLTSIGSKNPIYRDNNIGAFDRYGVEKPCL